MIRFSSAVAIGLGLAVFPVSRATAAAPASHWNGGRVPPVHRLAPLDAAGDKVSPSGRLPRPVSQAKTCGQCHDVAALSGGSHFRTGLDTNDCPVRCNFEPWFLTDAKSNTVQALSLCGLPGTKSPAEIGLTAWQFVKIFGRAFPGGGVASDPRAMEEETGDRSRWFVTGPLEANCLACHQQTPYDSSEWARQVLRENWAGAATAACGLGDVRGMNERLDATWDAYRAENPDDHLFRVPENTAYDATKFDSKGRCLFAVGKPRNENCLACHAVSQKDMPSHAIAGDVHLQRGMRCTDCHRNGMDHRIRTVSCKDCHLGPKGAGPRPVHAGFPAVHFEKLACTVCHAGVTEGGRRAQVRTNRANRIGIYGRAQWATDLPYVVEPVFAPWDGVIRPCRAVWTAKDAAPVLWPFAHDVRPARQARGARPNKCADCHTDDSDFFFGEVTPVYPDGSKGTPVAMTAFLKCDGLYHRTFGFMFAGRPVFKVVLWTVFALLVLLSVAVTACVLARAQGWLEENTDHFLWGAFKFVVDAGFVVCTLYLAVSGVAGWFLGGMTGWLLVGHMVAGGAFAVAVPLIALLKGVRRTAKLVPAIGWMLWVVLAAGVAFTAVMPMMTVFGHHGQEVLLWAHRLAALAFFALSAWICRRALARG